MERYLELLTWDYGYPMALPWPRRVLSNPSGGVLLGPWDVLLAGVGWCGRLPVGGWWGWFVGVELPRFGVAGGFGGLGGVECPAGGCVGESEVDEAS